MKLALVRQTYNPYGGAERFVERALSALSGERLALTLITRSWPTTPRGLAVRRCNPFYLGRLWRDRGFARCVTRIMNTGEFDLVQSHERIPGCTLYRAGDGIHATWLEIRAQVQGRPAQLATSLNPWHRYTLAAEAKMFRHPALRAVICNSHMVKDDLMRRFGLDAARLHVIHNGVDLDHFHPGLRDEHLARVRWELGICANC
jgi:UDP-glucose:(heptosyl)LPS alpha-1,3-glucosyltransferase